MRFFTIYSWPFIVLRAYIFFYTQWFENGRDRRGQWPESVERRLRVSVKFLHVLCISQVPSVVLSAHNFVVIRQLYSQAPSHSYRLYSINHITPSSCCCSHRRRSVQPSSDIFWSHQSGRDCCSPSGQPVRPSSSCSGRKEIHRTVTKDILFYFVSRRLVSPSFVTKLLWVIGRMCCLRGRTDVFHRVITRGNLLYYYLEARPSLLEFTVTYLPRKEKHFVAEFINVLMFHRL